MFGKEAKFEINASSACGENTLLNKGKQ